ncbi:MAG: hypothetical protein A2Z66_09405 [Chloroflexi bacterium RBG_13_66_10]|nr:MAG: hypothetical protein A2Z66_09405 [Chloroflexi bacterium RBG_13_66_10]
MNWQSAIVVAAIFVALGLLLLRVEPRVRRRIAVLVPIPLAILIYRWAAYRRAWWELVAGLGLAAAALGLWWALIGRRLPPPTEPAIHVWSKDDEP